MDRESDQEDMYTLNRYLQTIASYHQQFPTAGLPNIAAGLQQQIMQASSSLQSLPSSRIPSPHLPVFQRQSPTQSYNQTSPNFPSPPPAHMKRSASVCSRQSREGERSEGEAREGEVRDGEQRKGRDDSSSPPGSSTWSFEEQFKQLYDIDRDDPKRKEFLDDLFSFMQKHGRFAYVFSDEELLKTQDDFKPDHQGMETPVTRLPIMAKSVLDLYELYKLVVLRGGLVDVINKKLWQEVIKGLNLPSSITSAAFTLRTQYMKFLYRYECHKLNLSKPHELQAAIEGNKREGRRSSYYGDMAQHSPNSNGPHNGHHPAAMHHGQSQMSPVSLVTTSPSNTGSNRLQMNGHSSQFASHPGNASIPSTSLGIPPLMMQGSSPDLSEQNDINYMTYAFWNTICRNMPKPLQPGAVLPFQPARPPSQNSNNEAPLDLGTNRKDDSSLDLAVAKRVAANDHDGDDEDDNESEDSDSDTSDDPEFQIPLNNSSQDTKSPVISSPVVAKIKINGIQYKGVLHPRPSKKQKVGPL